MPEGPAALEDRPLEARLKSSRWESVAVTTSACEASCGSESVAAPPVSPAFVGHRIHHVLPFPSGLHEYLGFECSLGFPAA